MRVIVCNDLVCKNESIFYIFRIDKIYFETGLTFSIQGHLKYINSDSIPIYVLSWITDNSVLRNEENKILK